MPKCTYPDCSCEIDTCEKEVVTDQEIEAVARVLFREAQRFRVGTETQWLPFVPLARAAILVMHHLKN